MLLSQSVSNFPLINTGLQCSDVCQCKPSFRTTTLTQMPAKRKKKRPLSLAFTKINSLSLAGLQGFEPWKWRSQSPHTSTQYFLILQQKQRFLSKFEHCVSNTFQCFVKHSISLLRRICNKNLRSRWYKNQFPCPWIFSNHLGVCLYLVTSLRVPTQKII